MLHLFWGVDLVDREYYLTMAKWVNDQRICAIWTMRGQNVSLISFCDAGPWHCQTVSQRPKIPAILPSRHYQSFLNESIKKIQIVYIKVTTIESGLKGWLDVDAHLLFHPDGNSFLHLAPVQIDNTQDYYTNIVMVDAVKRHSWPVTQYKSEIHRLLGWDTAPGRNLV